MSLRKYAADRLIDVFITLLGLCFGVIISVTRGLIIQFTHVFNFHVYTVSQKKQDTKLLPITLPNIGRFTKFLHC